MIFYTDSYQNITSDKLKGFFVGWLNPPSPEVHLKLLKNSDYIVLAIDEKTGNVIGFISAISDGVLSAYIPFLEVLPTYQKKGIGAELIRLMLDKLNGYYMIDLLCDTDLQPFYEKFGMNRANGMMFRNYKKQSG